MKQKVILVCTECLSRNYTTNKNRSSDPERLELKKYCKKCWKTYNSQRKQNRGDRVNFKEWFSIKGIKLLK